MASHGRGEMRIPARDRFSVLWWHWVVTWLWCGLLNSPVVCESSWGFVHEQKLCWDPFKRRCCSPWEAVQVWTDKWPERILCACCLFQNIPIVSASCYSYTVVVFFLACCLYWYFASNCDPWAVKALHKPPAKGLLSGEEGAAWQPACCHLKMFLWSVLLFCRIIGQALTLLLSVQLALLAALLPACSRFLALRTSFAWSLQPAVWNLKWCLYWRVWQGPGLSPEPSCMESMLEKDWLPTGRSRKACSNKW